MCIRVKIGRDGGALEEKVNDSPLKPTMKLDHGKHAVSLLQALFQPLCETIVCKYAALKRRHRPRDVKVQKHELITIQNSI